MRGTELATWLDDMRAERWRWLDDAPTLRLVPMPSRRIVHPMAYAEQGACQGQPEHATGQAVDASANVQPEALL